MSNFWESVKGFFGKTPEAGRKIIRGGLGITAAVAGGKAVVDLLQGNLGSALASSAVAVGAGLGYTTFQPDSSLIPTPIRDGIEKDLVNAGISKKAVKQMLDAAVKNAIVEAGKTMVGTMPLHDSEEWKEAAKAFEEDENEQPLLKLIQKRAPEQYKMLHNNNKLRDAIFAANTKLGKVETAELVSAT